MISDFVFRAAFGRKYKDQEFVVPLMRRVIEEAAGFGFVDLFPSLKFIHFITGKRAKLENLQKQVDEVLDNVVKEHEEKRKKAKEDGVEVEDEDFVDVLLRIQQNENPDFKMTTTQIKALILVSKYAEHLSPKSNICDSTCLSPYFPLRTKLRQSYTILNVLTKGYICGGN